MLRLREICSAWSSSGCSADFWPQISSSWYQLQPSKLFVEITLVKGILMTRNRQLEDEEANEWIWGWEEVMNGLFSPKNHLCQTEPSTGARYSSLPMPFSAMQMQFCVRDTVHTKRCSPLLSREGGQKCFNKDNSHSGTTQVAVWMKTILRRVSTMI